MPITPLPQGEEKTRQVRAMFDAIATRYELVNKLMTFGLDARWRRRAVADLRLPPRVWCSTSPRAPGDFTRELVRQGHASHRDRPELGMLRRASEMPEASRPTRRCLPFVRPASTASRAVRAAQFHRPRGDLRRDGPGHPPRRSALAPRSRRTALGSVARRIPRLVPPRGAVHRLTRSRTARRTTTCPESTAYLPPSQKRSCACSTVGLQRGQSPSHHGRMSQQFIATRAR
jgi:hypothetical protein